MVQVRTSARPKKNVANAPAPGEYGAPRFDRRLSDKVLAAFNHAYASGATRAATRLRTVLADVEAGERKIHERRQSSAVAQADRWVAFVEARNAYNAALDDRATKPAQLDTALERMKESYRAWSESC